MIDMIYITVPHSSAYFDTKNDKELQDAPDIAFICAALYYVAASFLCPNLCANCSCEFEIAY